MVRAAADALGLHHVAEHAGGLEGGDVGRGVPVADRVPVVVQLVLGEEDCELGLAGAGASVLSLAGPACCFPGGHGHAGAVDEAVEHVRDLGRRQRDDLPGGDQRGPFPDGGGLRGAAGLGRPFHALDGQPDPGQVLQQHGGLHERAGGRGQAVHRRQPRGQGRACHAELGIARREAVLAGGAVIPGARQGDRPEDRIDGLVPVRDEFSLVTIPARHPQAAVTGVGGQQLPQDAAADPEHPGPDHGLGSFQPGAAAAQRPRGFCGQPPYLGGLLFRERGEEPPLSPPGTGGASVPATGRASQIFSFTSAICPTAAVNSACRAISRRTFSTSAAASCRPILFRRPSDRVHRMNNPMNPITRSGGFRSPAGSEAA